MDPTQVYPNEKQISGEYGFRFPYSPEILIGIIPFKLLITRGSLLILIPDKKL